MFCFRIENKLKEIGCWPFEALVLKFIQTISKLESLNSMKTVNKSQNEAYSNATEILRNQIQGQHTI